MSTDPISPAPARRTVEWRTISETIALGVAYALAAYVGLMLDAVSGFASLVWPASGIALAAIVLRGPALWPGIWVGAFVANVINDAPLLAATGIATGNTLEALVGCYALRAVGFNPALKRVRDAIALILLAAAGSTLVASTVGVASLYVTGVVPAAGFWPTWRAWWIGDLIGDLTVAPMMLVWSHALRRSPRKPRIIESALLAAFAAITVVVIFASPVRDMMQGLSGAYIVYPVLIWAAVRFGPRGAISTGFIVSAVAIIATIGGTGPFVQPELFRSLLGLQIFVGVQAATFLVLGASIGERRDAQRVASEARATAEEANMAKASFLAVMSHELRTPLNAISGYVQLLEMDIHGSLTGGQRDSLERIQRNQRHLLGLINDILGFARVETGNLTLSSEPIPAWEALAEIEPIVRPEVEKKKISYSAPSPEKSMTIFADRERLRQILVNVISNAIKFTPDGGRVSVSVVRDDAGCVEMRVSDNGIGIAPEHQARVFEPFVQADKGHSRRYSGVGLGLSIVRDLVRAMQGDARLESESGKGTTVIITLPEGPAGCESVASPHSIL